MRDLIPLAQPANSWKGFLLRVLVIAAAASLVLGAAALFGWTLDPFGSGPHRVSEPVSATTPHGEN